MLEITAFGRLLTNFLRMESTSVRDDDIHVSGRRKGIKGRHIRHRKYLANKRKAIKPDKHPTVIQIDIHGNEEYKT